MWIGCQRFSCCKNARLVTGISPAIFKGSAFCRRSRRRCRVECLTYPLACNSISRTKNSHIIEFNSFQSFVVPHNVSSAQLNSTPLISFRIVEFVSFTLGNSVDSRRRLAHNIRCSYFEYSTLRRTGRISECVPLTASMDRVLSRPHQKIKYDTHGMRTLGNKLCSVFVFVSNAASLATIHRSQFVQSERSFSSLSLFFS